MTSIKRATNKPINKVRDLSTATKILITGNGSGAAVNRLQKDLGAFIDDLEALDAAVWKVIHHNKERLYRVLDMLAERGRKKSEGPMGELKKAWNNVLGSGQTVGHDVKTAARTFRNKVADETGMS